MNYKLSVSSIQSPASVLRSPFSGFRSPVSVLLFMICFCHTGFCKTMGEPVFAKKETLYSTKSGSPIGEVLLSVEAKSADAKNNEWYIIIGDKNNNFFEAENKSMWIFNKKVNVYAFKKDMKNRDYPLEDKDFREFLAFSENEVRFNLRDWEELRKQTQISFNLNAKAGDKMSLRLVFYIASKDKKKTTIDDEARVKIDFVIPVLSEIAAAKKAEANQGEELISLTEKIDYEAVEKNNEERRADSIKQTEAEDRIHRITLLNSFITERNNEINSLRENVDVLLADKKNKVEALKIDSFETVVEELKKKVDYWEKGYTDILLTEEGIHDKFSKFGITHGITSKKLVELRQQQDLLNNLLSYLKKNWLKSLGIGIVALIIGKLLFSLIKKLISKARNSIKQKMNKIKKKAQDKLKQKSMKKTKKDELRKDFEDIDISELDEI